MIPFLSSLVLPYEYLLKVLLFESIYIFSDDKDDPESKKVLDTLENIDDECDK